MRKKLLTLALVAVMTLGSAFSVFAAESPDLNDSPDLNGSPALNGSSDTGNVETEDDDVDDASISETVAAEIEKAAKVEGLDNVKLTVSPVSKKDLEAVAKAGKTLLANKKYEVVDLKLFDLAGKMLTALNGKVKVTLPVFENIKNAKYVAVYRLDGAALTSLGTVEVKAGKFTFETDHFSTYVFVEASAPAATAAPEAAAPDTGDTAPVATAVAVAALAAAACGVVSYKKKNA